MSDSLAEDYPELREALRRLGLQGCFGGGMGDELDVLIATTATLLADRDRLARQVEAVRALHSRGEDDTCDGCGSTEYGHNVQCYPCPTIRALEGES